MGSAPSGSAALPTGCTPGRKQLINEVRQTPRLNNPISQPATAPISPQTAAQIFNVRDALRKLGVGNRVEAGIIADRAGLSSG